MYRKNKETSTSLEVRNVTEGETIEEKMRRVVNNNEPITDGAPLVYTNRKDGVLPQYDIRTDRWDVAIDAMDKVTKTETAKREARLKVVKNEPEEKKGDNGDTESIQATN